MSPGNETIAQRNQGKEASYIYKNPQNCQTKNWHEKVLNFVMEWVENEFKTYPTLKLEIY